MCNLYYGLLRNHLMHLCSDHWPNAVVIMGSCAIIMGNGRLISHLHLYNISPVSYVVLYNIYTYIHTFIKCRISTEDFLLHFNCPCAFAC